MENNYNLDQDREFTIVEKKKKSVKKNIEILIIDPHNSYVEEVCPNWLQNQINRTNILCYHNINELPNFIAVFESKCEHIRSVVLFEKQKDDNAFI